MDLDFQIAINKQKSVQQYDHNLYLYERQANKFLWFGSFRTNVEWWNVILTKVTAFVTALLTTTIRETPQTRQTRRTVGQIPKKCKETSNLMWLSMIWFISVLFVCWNLFCTIANLRIKCVTETKNVSVLFYKNVKSSFSTWLTHLTLRFLYILGCSGPRWAMPSITTFLSSYTII